MAGETRIDPPTLDSIAERLSRAADALDGVGRTSPGVPDAGDVSGIMAAAIAHLTANAGNLVLGMRSAGEETTRARQEYAAQDESAGHWIRGL